MAITDIQRRLREIGRIRLGQKSAKGAPQRLERFRFTSRHRELVEKVAGLYGGNVAEWQHPSEGRQWEVISDATRVPVIVTPEPVSQFYELWSGGGIERRCDGDREFLSDSPCLCSKEDGRTCKPTTRLSVMLRDLDALGVWRLESHGYYAAAELPGVAELCGQAGRYIPAWLTLEERVVKRQVNGKPETRRFMVPGLEPEITPAALVIESGPPDTAAGAIERAASSASGTPSLASVDSTPISAPSSSFWTLADDATTVDEIRAIWKRAADAGDLDESLKQYLSARVTDIEPPKGAK